VIAGGILFAVLLALLLRYYTLKVRVRGADGRRACNMGACVYMCMRR
jgi:hypothetical protein